MRLDAGRTLGWRLERQFLATERASSVVEVVDRVLAVRGWPSSVADLACGVRLGEPVHGAVDRALEDGDLVRTYLFGGGSYVVTPRVAAVLSTVRTTSGVWQTARFQRQGGFTLDDWEPLRAAVRARSPTVR